uniref:ERCC4 domain-containing protein n=1 Tax=Panagrellus redivivus TaxID=6233 RepID=A0A7E4ZY81_PANRE
MDSDGSPASSSVTINDDDESEDVIVEEEDGRVELLPHEQELLLDTMNDDVLFVTGRGLGLERLILHHLHLYSDSKLLVLVINATPADEHFYLHKLKQINPGCPPKLINSSVTNKQREQVYLDGGIQFITSRVLMTDLLTKLIPSKNVTGIIVFRAHELLSSYQESFILRLYREQKADGFVKAFSDQPTAITSGGLGQLQRLFDKLYIKKIRLLPRFDTVIKSTYDIAPPKLSEFEVELPMGLRRVRLSLMDIVRTCVRELKSTVHSLEIVVEDDAMSPSAALYPTKLELDLRSKTLLLTDRQTRIMNDLRLLRTLLRKVEDLDPYSAFKFLQGLRNDKDLVDNNSGWLFTPTAAKVFSGLEGLCATKASEKAPPMVATPPKWNALRTVLNELAEKDLSDNDKILLITPSDECSRQLVDVIKFGGPRFQWMLTKAMMAEKPNPGETPGKEPSERSWWNPNCVVLYDTQIDLKNEHKTLVTKLQNQQKKASKNSKRGRVAEASETPEAKKYRQSSLVNFGVMRHESRQKS